MVTPCCRLPIDLRKSLDVSVTTCLPSGSVGGKVICATAGFCGACASVRELPQHHRATMQAPTNQYLEVMNRSFPSDPCYRRGFQVVLIRRKSGPSTGAEGTW